MTTANLYQLVELKQDVPNSFAKAGHKGLVLDHHNSNANQPEPGYTLEVFENDKTLDIVSIPISWCVPISE